MAQTKQQTPTLITELFDIVPENLPALSAYDVTVRGSNNLVRSGRKLADRLMRRFGGHWVWTDDVIVTDAPQSTEAIDQAIREIRIQEAESSLAAAEANFAGDPLAADKVLGSGMPATCVGLDVSERTIMDERFIDKLRAGAGAAGEFIHAITRLYFGFYQGLSGRRECPIHDSSAVACLLRPELYAMETAAVRVVTEGLAMGQSIAGDPQGAYVSSAWRGRPACRLCKGVDAEAVRQLYLDTLGV